MILSRSLDVYLCHTFRAGEPSNQSGQQFSASTSFVRVNYLLLSTQIGCLFYNLFQLVITLVIQQAKSLFCTLKLVINIMFNKHLTGQEPPDPEIMCNQLHCTDRMRVGKMQLHSQRG